MHEVVYPLVMFKTTFRLCYLIILIVTTTTTVRTWCGNLRSSPPLWISILSPRIFDAMAEHSICQPGRPSPHRALGHLGSFSLDFFQSAKSLASRFCALSISLTVNSPSPSLINYHNTIYYDMHVPVDCRQSVVEAFRTHASVCMHLHRSRR